MLIASGETAEGKRLILGLDAENMRRLANDEPIEKDLGAIIPGLAGWKLFILGPEDLHRFLAQAKHEA